MTPHVTKELHPRAFHALEPALNFRYYRPADEAIGLTMKIGVVNARLGASSG